MDSIILHSIAEFSKILQSLATIKSSIKNHDPFGLLTSSEPVIDLNSITPIAIDLMNQCVTEIGNITSLLTEPNGSCKGCGGHCSPPISDADTLPQPTKVCPCKGKCEGCGC